MYYHNRSSSWPATVLFTILLGFGSCSQDYMMTDQAREVSGAVFEKMYDANRTTMWHNDYLGMKNGYHYIAVFDPGWGDITKYQFSVRTPVSQLPISFPDRPQKQITSPRGSMLPNKGRCASRPDK